MCKKYLTLILTILVINLSLSSVAFAVTKEEKEAKFAEKVKTNVAKLGTGKDARIEVKLKDGAKLKGYVSQINENSYVIINDKTGASTEIPYSNTKQVKGNNLSTGAKIATGIAIGAGAFLLLVFIGLHYAD